MEQTITAETAQQRYERIEKEILEDPTKKRLLPEISGWLLGELEKRYSYDHLRALGYYDEQIAREQAVNKEIDERKRQRKEKEDKKEKDRLTKDLAEHEVVHDPWRYWNSKNRALLEPISDQLMRRLLDKHTNIELEYLGFPVPAAERFDGQILGLRASRTLLVRLPNGEDKLIKV